MSTPSRRRLLRDFKRIQDDPPVGVSASPTNDDIMRFPPLDSLPSLASSCFPQVARCDFWPRRDAVRRRCARAAAASFSQLFAGTFRLSLEFSEEYPNKPPVVKWISHMFHPNGARALPSLGSFSHNIFSVRGRVHLSGHFAE